MLRNWDDLRIFLAVARERSLSDAAAALEVSQPTVSRRLKELERRLSATLIDRGAEGHTLTPAGQQILTLVEELDRGVNAVERRVAGTDTRISGKVQVAATTGLARLWLAARLAPLLEQEPDLDIDLCVGIDHSDLLRREADVALRFGDPGSDQLVGRRLGQVHCGLYASPSYLADRGEPTSPNELTGHVMIESARLIDELVQVRELRRMSKGARARITSDNVEVQLAAAEAGLGIVPLLTYMRHGAPTLQRILRPHFDIPLDLWLLTHRDLRDNARVRRVLDFVYERWQQDRDWLGDV
ncbi:MAG: LysR family transcriptional regulator [Pseudomonadota bacterium]